MINESADLSTLSDADLASLVLQLQEKAERLEALAKSKKESGDMADMEIALRAYKDASATVTRITDVNFEQYQRANR